MWYFDQIHQKIDIFLLHNNWWKHFNEYSLEQDELFKKMEKLTCPYAPMYSPLDDYPLYYDKKSEIFEANVNKEFICIHGYTNHYEHNVLITWLSINSGEIWLSEISLALDINPCHRTIMDNTCEEIHVSGDILNAVEKF